MFPGVLSSILVALTSIRLVTGGSDNSIKAQHDEQREFRISMKKDMQEAISNAIQEQKQELEESQHRELLLKEDAKVLQNKIQEQKQELEESQHRELLLKEDARELQDKIQEKEKELEESQHREVLLKEDVKELKNKVEFLNRVQAATAFCKQKEIVKKLAQSLGPIQKGSSLDKGLLKLLDSSSVAGSQLEKVLRSDSIPLWTIAHTGYVELASLLLCGGLPVDQEVNHYGSHMLHTAADSGQLQLASLLLLHGEDVDAKRSFDGFTPLIVAAEKGHLEMVKLLVLAGADVSVRDKNSNTVLYWSQVYKRTEVIKFLKSL